MNLIEKIKKLSWFDHLTKIKVILLDIVDRLEGNSSGGSSTLQDVLENGNMYSSNNGFSNAIIAGKVGELNTTRFVESGNGSSTFSIFPEVIVLENESSDFLEKTTFKVASSVVSIEEIRSRGNINFYTPFKKEVGNYTLSAYPNAAYTVATLPEGVLNDIAVVSDATSPTYLGTLVGGGSIITPVWHNGTEWVSR